MNLFYSSFLRFGTDKRKATSFVEYAKDVQLMVLVTLIQTIVERICIDYERFCYIFIKVCIGEDYTGFF